jgi:hypothetical protein
VRQVYEIHDAEHQRQAGGKEKQQRAELYAVEKLDNEKSPVHFDAGRPVDAATRPPGPTGLLHALDVLWTRYFIVVHLSA